jgi:prophage maintenance system killer protein
MLSRVNNTSAITIIIITARACMLGRASSSIIQNHCPYGSCKRVAVYIIHAVLRLMGIGFSAIKNCWPDSLRQLACTGRLSYAACVSSTC